MKAAYISNDYDLRYVGRERDVDPPAWDIRHGGLYDGEWCVIARKGGTKDQYAFKKVSPDRSVIEDYLVELAMRYRWFKVDSYRVSRMVQREFSSHPFPFRLFDAMSNVELFDTWIWIYRLTADFPKAHRVPSKPTVIANWEKFLLFAGSTFGWTYDVIMEAPEIWFDPWRAWREGFEVGYQAGCSDMQGY